MTQAIDTQARQQIAIAVAKAIAYKNVGDQRKANEWATRIVYLLDTMDILDQRNVRMPTSLAG